MLDRELKERLKDFFEGFELVEYLQISTEDIIEAFEDEIEEVIEDVEEFMRFGTKG